MEQILSIVRDRLSFIHLILVYHYFVTVQAVVTNYTHSNLDILRFERQNFLSHYIFSL